MYVLRKGSGVAIVGRICSRKLSDGGVQTERVEVIAQAVQFVDPPGRVARARETGRDMDPGTDGGLKPHVFAEADDGGGVRHEEAGAAPLGIHPVVVGGMAVYFWTASEEFLTYDIDVVMDVPEELAKRLAELGFARVPDGRHWTLEGTDIFLEAPSSRLDADAVVSEYPPKRT